MNVLIDFLFVATAVLVLVCLVALLVCIWREGKIDATEFARRFPGRCMICSYHRYGIDYGFVDPRSRPEPHRCIEAPRG